MSLLDLDIEIDKARREVAMVFGWLFAGAPVKDRAMAAEQHLMKLLAKRAAF